MQHLNKMMIRKFSAFGISLVTSLAVATPTVLKASCDSALPPGGASLIFQQTFSRNLIANGIVGSQEWVPALNPPIPPGTNWYIGDSGNGSDPDPMGAVYALGRKNYPVNGYNYSGCFLFMLHNIELLTVEDDFDYNVFDVFSPDTGELKLTIWVFNEINNPDDSNPDWLTPAGLKADFPDGLDDRGFLVYNYELDSYRQWLPDTGNASPANGGYDWNYYWGVHALGGFNNSAYENGLPLTIDNDNELYEVIYRLGDEEVCDGDSTDLVVRRSVKDPDDQQVNLITYWDDDVGICRPLLVEFDLPFTVTKTNQETIIDWKIKPTEIDEGKIAKVELWRAPLPSGEQDCPADPTGYNATSAIQLEAIPRTDSNGNSAFCYGLRVIESSGEENWYIK